MLQPGTQKVRTLFAPSAKAPFNALTFLLYRTHTDGFRASILAFGIKLQKLKAVNAYAYVLYIKNIQTFCYSSTKREIYDLETCQMPNNIRAAPTSIIALNGSCRKRIPLNSAHIVFTEEMVEKTTTGILGME